MGTLVYFEINRPKVRFQSDRSRLRSRSFRSRQIGSPDMSDSESLGTEIMPVDF